MRSSPDQLTQAVSDGYATAFLEEDRAICERAQAGMAAKLSSGVRWLTLGALAIVIAAVIFNFQWIWGLLFLFWSATSLGTGMTFLVEPVNRDENLWLFWAIATMWLGLSLALIGIDLTKLVN